MKVYTALGRYVHRSDMGDTAYLAIVCNGMNYKTSIQELAVWTVLYRRILVFHQLEERYQQTLGGTRPAGADCAEVVGHLVKHGLIVEGEGKTQEDALYDLLSNLYVRPTARNPLKKLAVYVKLVAGGYSRRVAKTTACAMPLSEIERRIVMLARQTQLTTAELVKCVERGVSDLSSEEKVLAALYSDGAITCENFADHARSLSAYRPVLEAVSNLHLNGRIVLERC